jgi:hypothetical protein
MPHGRYVPFESNTNAPHKCGVHKSSKSKRGGVKLKETPTIKTPNVLNAGKETSGLPPVSSGRVFARENTPAYEAFFAKATPPKNPEAIVSSACEPATRTHPLVWVILTALIMTLFFSLYLNLSAKPKVIMVENKIPATARPGSHSQAEGLSKDDTKAEQAKDYEFIPDPSQPKQGN